MADKDYSRGFVNYTSRDYPSLMEHFWSLVPALTELWKPTDASEVRWTPEASSDPGVVLGVYLASVADMLGVNTDMAATELYAPTVSQRKAAEKLFNLIGYHLGWYTAAKTEVTFTNNTEDTLKLNFGWNGSDFPIVRAYTDITGNSRTITYNIIPNTNSYGNSDSRAIRQEIADSVNIFSDSDIVYLEPNKSVTRLAIEGSVRSIKKSVTEVINNNYIINLPSQHIDTSAIWLKDRDDKVRWKQVSSPSEFIEPEPRFAITYDNYSNARIQISNYVKNLENYQSIQLEVYWIDCSGALGCIADNVLQDLLFAVTGSNGSSEEATSESGNITISNLSNIKELPHTYTITGKSPETAREAYYNSRNYINTNNSLITLPDYNRFLLREPGVDCGTVIDCQKALEINIDIYNNDSLTDAQKKKMYITNSEFNNGAKSSERSTRIQNIVRLRTGINNISQIPFDTNFNTYSAMCYFIHNNFESSRWGDGEISVAQLSNKNNLYKVYTPPVRVMDAITRDFLPLQSLSVEIGYGGLRVFDFYIVGQIYTNRPVSQTVGDQIINSVYEALNLYYHPTNRKLGDVPNIMEIVEVIKSANEAISYFDAGNIKNPVIVWNDCDAEYFNPISFAKYVQQPSNVADSPIRIAPECISRN